MKKMEDNYYVRMADSAAGLMEPLKKGDKYKGVIIEMRQQWLAAYRRKELPEWLKMSGRWGGENVSESLLRKLRTFKEDKERILVRCYIDGEKQILGLCDSSAIFNVVVPAGWTIKRYRGDFFPPDEKLLKTMLERPYDIEVLTEDRIFD